MTEARQEINRDQALRAFLNGEDDRVAAIMARLEACYIRSKRDDDIAEQLKRLIVNSLKKRFPKLPEGDDNRKAGVGFVVVGESGSGKTTALEKALTEHPAFPGYGVPDSGCIFISVLVPSPCTLAQLGNATLEALGYDTDKPLRENEAWKRVRKMLRKKRVMFLHFDDAHNVLQQATAKERKKIKATFRNTMISRDWPVQLVMSGTRETLELFGAATPSAKAKQRAPNTRQLSRRVKYVIFDDLQPETDANWILEVLEDFTAKAGLKYKETPGVMLIERLCHAAAYQFGLAIEILLEAIEIALRANRKDFGIKDLADAYEGRTAQPDKLNVFVSRSWLSLDPTIIFQKEDEDEDGEDA